ncbi:hypothetical protein PVAP13_7KG359455 [Panicum virgatum]|uniref:Uncharacterized protein n=1 Tax=Panicum virgatum TaxID=38727 RepID=A0A8T0QDR1_PANVG|nr:hypothetical protein PVAP13_7KG359455 [Panicum virgatum]
MPNRSDSSSAPPHALLRSLPLALLAVLQSRAIAIALRSRGWRGPPPPGRRGPPLSLTQLPPPPHPPPELLPVDVGAVRSRGRGGPAPVVPHQPPHWGSTERHSHDQAGQASARRLRSSTGERD